MFLSSNLFFQLMQGSKPYCEEVIDKEATFPTTISGQRAIGNCSLGYDGDPMKTCIQSGSEGIWSVTSNPCYGFYRMLCLLLVILSNIYFHIIVLIFLQTIFQTNNLMIFLK